jgi:hypothetical protein
MESKMKTQNFAKAALLGSFTILISSSCSAQVSDTSKLNDPAKMISLQLGPCYGPCPIFSVSVDANGNGVFDGKAYVKQIGHHKFKVKPADFEALRVHLDQYRPKGKKRYDETAENCPNGLSTDSPSVDVKWDNADELYIYLGCQFPNSKNISDAVYNSWKKLPIEHLVGDDQNRHLYKKY